jgi:hypothetical protein
MSIQVIIEALGDEPRSFYMMPWLGNSQLPVVVTKRYLAPAFLHKKRYTAEKTTSAT